MKPPYTRSLRGTRKGISEFNDIIQEDRKWIKRRVVPTTPTIFFDSEFQILPKFRWASSNWCLINHDLAFALEHHRSIWPIINYSNEDQTRFLNDSVFAKLIQVEIPVYLCRLGQAYLAYNLQFVDDFTPRTIIRVRIAIHKLNLELQMDNKDIMVKSHLITYLRKQLRAAKIGVQLIQSDYNLVSKPTDLLQTILKMKNEGVYTIKEICKSLNISVSKYYYLMNRSKLAPDMLVQLSERLRNKNSLTLEEEKHIKHLLDSPKHSYNVPEICANIKDNYDHQVTPSIIRRFIKNKLGYTYKRNHFKTPNVFKPEEAVARYKIAKQLISYLHEGKNIICLDETGIKLGISREYSYAPKGQHPFRSRIMSPSTRHLLMAITSKKVFAYTIRKKGHNEHSFIAFIIDIVHKVIKLGPEYVNKTVLFMDNAPFHKSDLAMRLLKMLPIQVCFNVRAMCDYNPIETLFGIMKRRLKFKRYTQM